MHLGGRGEAVQRVVAVTVLRVPVVAVRVVGRRPVLLQRHISVVGRAALTPGVAAVVEGQAAAVPVGLASLQRQGAEAHVVELTAHVVAQLVIERGERAELLLL